MIVIGIDGSKWIKTNRTKTDVKSSIPLLPTALAILESIKTIQKQITQINYCLYSAIKNECIL
jgi:hypothetical protein